MIDVPREIVTRFDARLALEPIPERLHPFYRRWLRFYLDFCCKYQHDASSRKSLSPFLEKLADKKQSSQFRKQAAHAISFFYDDYGGVPSTTIPPPQKSGRSPLKPQSTANAAGSSRSTTVTPPPTSPDTPLKTAAPIPPETANPKLTNADWHSAYAGLKSEIAIRHYSPKTLRA